MAFCPICGTENNNGAKFCCNCGGAMNTVQDQPAQQAVPKAPEGFTPIPEPPKNGFVPITPENPLPGYTPIQPVYAQPITQPVQKAVNKPKSNGFCNAGLTFSIIGLCTIGSTSLIGLILSFASIIMAVPKDEKAEAILEALPGANCGACGFSGCSGYANALAKGEAEVGLCAPGGLACTKAVSEILGVETGSIEPKVAVGRDEDRRRTHRLLLRLYGAGRLRGSLSL